MYRWLCEADPTTYICQALQPAYFAEWMQAAVAFMALAGVVIGVRLTRRTLIEMQLQTQTLRDQMVLTDRAWLKVAGLTITAITRRPNVDADVLSVTIQIKVENVGGSTAIDVDSLVSVFPVPVQRGIMHDQVSNWREVVEVARSSSPREDDEIPVGRTVFPSGQTTFEWYVSVPISDIEAQQYNTDEDGPCVSLYTIGCVSYRLPNDHLTRVSSFGYDIRRIQPDSQGGWTESLRFPLEGLKSNSGAKAMPIPALFKAD
jgi:hypothetical protein